MNIPPVFCVDDLTPELIDDLRDASATYCRDYCYTVAFDELFLVSERCCLIQAYLVGDVPAMQLAESLRNWLLRRWSSTRSLGNGRMQAVGDALGRIRPEIAGISPDLPLDQANRSVLSQMASIFGQLDACAGVGPTIASKILAPLRPALFPIWDNPIAWAYGFALNAAGYHQYLRVTQAIARRAREFWGASASLEEYLKPPGRKWTAPLAKVLDEWNWIRITRRTERLHTTCPAGRAV